MTRTQIYLPSNLHKDLLSIARAENTTLSELIRKGAKTIINKKRKRDESWKLMAKLEKYNLKRLPKDLSEKHDEYYIKSIFGK